MSDRGVQALRDYELKNDMREPWDTANEHVKNTWRATYRRLEDAMRKHGMQIVEGEK